MVLYIYTYCIYTTLRSHSWGSNRIANGSTFCSCHHLVFPGNLVCRPGQDRSCTNMCLCLPWVWGSCHHQQPWQCPQPVQHVLLSQPPPPFLCGHPLPSPVPQWNHTAGLQWHWLLQWTLDVDILTSVPVDRTTFSKQVDSACIEWYSELEGSKSDPHCTTAMPQCVLQHPQWNDNGCKLEQHNFIELPIVMQLYCTYVYRSWDVRVCSACLSAEWSKSPDSLVHGLYLLGTYITFN